jgi:glycosyltransferase involved in cell wall biosynthesis
VVLALPANAVQPGRSVTVTLRDTATGRQIGVTLPVTWNSRQLEQPPVAPPSPHVLQGNLDRVTRDGWVSGWCWYPAYPHEHVDLTILVDDEAVGSVRAVEFRADLKEAGIGDGSYGFSFALPWSALAEKGMLRVTVLETGSSTALGDPILMRAGRLAVAEERIQDLERQIRLLRSQIDELGRQNQGRDEDRAARELFATVAGFFRALGEGNVDDVMSGGLKAAVDDLTTRFAPLALALPEAPLATICVDAGASVDMLYRCLSALHETGCDDRADIMLLDDGALGGGAALLPAVVRNLHYVRVPAHADRMAARNEVAAHARGAVVAYLAPQVRVLPGWLDEIVATFAHEPDAAAVGSKVLRDDGLLHHTGIVLDANGTLRDPGRLAAADDPEHDFLRAVHGLGDVAFALRRDMMAEVGGFGTGFDSSSHAVFDLCMRLHGRGRDVLYQPLAVALWTEEGAPDPGPVPDLSLQDEDSRRLRQHWVDFAPPGRAGGRTKVDFVGHALVIDSAVPRPDHDAGSVATLEQMLLLRRLGYRVSFATASGEEAAPKDIDLLRRSGIELVRLPRYASATQYLEASGGSLDLVQIYRHVNATLFLDRVAELAPQAKVVFSPADLHYLREVREAELTGRLASGPAETREQELRCIRRSDATILTSSHEVDLLRGDVDPAKLHLLRWIAHPLASPRGFAGRSGACFVGSFTHSPNADGLRWFVAEVLPLILRESPGLRVYVAGGDVPESVLALASDNVVFLGQVPDLAGLFDSVRLSLAPLRYGAGFKGKVATSLENGVPVVGTTIAMEGTGLLPGDGVAVADDPEAFAREVVRLHRDEPAWTTLAATGLQRCRELFSPDVAQGVYRKLLADLGMPTPVG